MKVSRATSRRIRNHNKRYRPDVNDQLTVVVKTPVRSKQQQLEAFLGEEIHILFIVLV